MTKRSPHPQAEDLHYQTHLMRRADQAAGIVRRTDPVPAKRGRGSYRRPKAGARSEGAE